MKRVITGQYDDKVSVLERENREVAYKAAVESFVLLKNDGCLPLKEKEVALFGAGATHTIKGGTGSGEVNNRHSISIYEGLKDAAESMDYDAIEEMMEEVKRYEIPEDDLKKLQALNEKAGQFDYDGMLEILNNSPD